MTESRMADTEDDTLFLERPGLLYRSDKLLETVARQVYEFSRTCTDELWSEIWTFHTDSYTVKMGGEAALITAAQKIIKLVQANEAAQMNLTPSPWKFHAESGEIRPDCEVKCIQGHTMAKLELQHGPWQLDNGRLMAASPDLLDALRGFVLNRAHIRTDEDLQPMLDKLFDIAAAAVAKAQG